MSPHLDRIGIGGYRLLGYESKQVIEIHVEHEEAAPRCRCCGGDRLHSKGRYLRSARHLDGFGQTSKLIVHCRRYYCLDCCRSFIPQLPGILPWRRSTEPFREEVYLQHHDGICAARLSDNLSIGEATIERIYHQFTERKAKERLSLQCPRVLGIDEHTLHKGQRFATTFCDLKNHRVFDVVLGKSQKDLSSFVAQLQGREHVRVVCIDLSSPYRQLITQWFPNSKIVADRFHVVRIIMAHFLTLFRQIAPSIKNNKGLLALLRTKPENLDPLKTQRLRQLLNSFPALEPFYQKMHHIRKLMNFKHQSKNACRQLITDLLENIEHLSNCGIQPLITLAKTLKYWSQEIARMWRFSKSNGITEGFHRKMKLIQRRAYGFRNFNNYRLRVIAHCG